MAGRERTIYIILIPGLVGIESAGVAVIGRVVIVNDNWCNEGGRAIFRNRLWNFKSKLFVEIRYFKCFYVIYYKRYSILFYELIIFYERYSVYCKKTRTLNNNSKTLFILSEGI